MKFNTLCIKIGIMQLLFSIHTVHTLTQAVYVVSGNEVQLINGATNALVTTISLPASAASNGIAIVPDGFYAYVGATTAALYLLNLTTSSYVSTISTGLS